MKDLIYDTLMEFYGKGEKDQDEQLSFAQVINSDLAESINNILERQGAVYGVTAVSEAIARSWHDNPANIHARLVANEICRRIDVDAA